MLADRSRTMYLAHFHQLTNHQLMAADSPLLFELVVAVVYCVWKRVVDAHVQLIELFEIDRDH